MTNHDHYTLYANPYFTLADDSRYMKHIYIGGERIATEAGTLSPLFGTYQSGDVASKYLGNAPVDYSAKYDSQQLAYQSAYAAFGVPLNGYAPPASKTAGYVKNSALPTLNGLNMAGDSMGETESSDEIDGVSETEADEVWDDNESWEEEAADYTAVDNEESQVEESTDEVSAEETSSIADANESMRLLKIGSSKICEGVYFYHKDHLGSSTLITNDSGNVVQRIEYLPYGEVFLERHGGDNHSMLYKFNGKELDEEKGLYYYGARYYDPRLSLWLGTDPMQGKYPGISAYAFCMNNPLSLLDLEGREPVYSRSGTYLGSTSEGFTGDVLIYLGDDKVDFSKFTRKELVDIFPFDIETLDIMRVLNIDGVSLESQSNIWTHIASKFKGLSVYDEIFSLSNIQGEKIWTDIDPEEQWGTIFCSNKKPRIVGTGNYEYESTVENIASSIIVHEWYSHVMKGYNDTDRNHNLAYKNVIGYNNFWEKTTFKYKQFNWLKYAKYLFVENALPLNLYLNII